MRDHFRTPQQLHKLPNRKLKWSSEQSRSPKRIVKQSLDSVIAPGSDDVLINFAKDLDDVQVDESSMENFIKSSSTAVSPSIASADFDLSPLCSTLTSDDSPSSSDLSLWCSTPTGDASPVSSNLSELSSTMTLDKVESNDVKLNRRTADLSEHVKGDSWKTELFAKKIRQVGTERKNSEDMILLSKRVLEELLKIAIEELHNLPEKRDWFSEIAENKVMNVLRKVFLATLTFMLLIICVGVFIFSSDDGSFYNGLVPT
ncbi:hypothetical protein POM88_027092 [Heracleum sosnowskyi]|uniref:Uncharacterized protein n=1 Tax=Heracleum sosnowskyi TaxID=360622 RepID=A0AAD8I7U0_9APIA|nr:hypothetical protein POM88_027092 [Heracleum sosnowskyi]